MEKEARRKLKLRNKTQKNIENQLILLIEKIKIKNKLILRLKREMKKTSNKNPHKINITRVINKIESIKNIETVKEVEKIVETVKEIPKVLHYNKKEHKLDVPISDKLKQNNDLF